MTLNIKSYKPNQSVMIDGCLCGPSYINSTLKGENALNVMVESYSNNILIRFNKFNIPYRERVKSFLFIITRFIGAESEAVKISNGNVQIIQNVNAITTSNTGDISFAITNEFNVSLYCFNNTEADINDPDSIILLNTLTAVPPTTSNTTIQTSLFADERYVRKSEYIPGGNTHVSVELPLVVVHNPDFDEHLTLSYDKSRFAIEHEALTSTDYTNTQIDQTISDLSQTISEQYTTKGEFVNTIADVRDTITDLQVELDQKKVDKTVYNDKVNEIDTRIDNVVVDLSTKSTITSQMALETRINEELATKINGYIDAVEITGNGYIDAYSDKLVVNGDGKTKEYNFSASGLTYRLFNDVESFWNARGDGVLEYSGLIRKALPNTDTMEYQNVVLNNVYKANTYKILNFTNNEGLRQYMSSTYAKSFSSFNFEDQNITIIQSDNPATNRFFVIVSNYPFEPTVESKFTIGNIYAFDLADTFIDPKPLILNMFSIVPNFCVVVPYGNKVHSLFFDRNLTTHNDPLIDGFEYLTNYRPHNDTWESKTRAVIFPIIRISEDETDIRIVGFDGYWGRVEYAYEENDILFKLTNHISSKDLRLVKDRVFCVAVSLSPIDTWLVFNLGNADVNDTLNRQVLFCVLIHQSFEGETLYLRATKYHLNRLTHQPITTQPNVYTVMSYDLNKTIYTEERDYKLAYTWLDPSNVCHIDYVYFGFDAMGSMYDTFDWQTVYKGDLKFNNIRIINGDGDLTACTSDGVLFTCDGNEYAVETPIPPVIYQSLLPDNAIYPISGLFNDKIQYALRKSDIVSLELLDTVEDISILRVGDNEFQIKR